MLLITVSTNMEFRINTTKYNVSEDAQSSLTDADLLKAAAQLEAKKLEAKKTLDSAQETYNNTVQQIDQQLVQLINQQAQRNSQQAQSANKDPRTENESVLNEENEESPKLYRVLLDDFLPRVLGLAYDGKYIQKLASKAGLRCYEDDENGLCVVLRNPGDLGILFQIMEDNYLDERDYEEAILSQLPGEFTRAFYAGEY